MFCKKCGEIIPAGAEFCMSCGTKVNDEKKVEKTLKTSVDVKSPETNVLKDKTSVFHAEKKEDANINSDNNKTKKNNKKSRKWIILGGIIAVAVLLAAGIGVFCYTEFTPQGQYFKGVQIYNYLCKYSTSNEDLNNFMVDDECMKKLEEGRDCFEKAGNTEDAKLFYYCFKAYVNLMKTNGNWESSTTDVFIKQSISDIMICKEQKLIPDNVDFLPEKASQKLYMYVYANIDMAVALWGKEIKLARYGYDMYDLLREANDGPYCFCGKDTDQLQSGWDFVLFEYGA